MAQGLKIGTILHGNYRIDGVLGQGGFGITYLAMDLSLDRKVAIKEFFPKDYCDREGDTSHVTLGTKNTTEFVNKLKAKFLKEAKNIAKFDNPGIIKIHAAFEENNTAYYVMDFIEGESLSAIVKKNGPLPEGKALDYIRKVGKALEYVHSHKMNHLDVKPANIMVRRKDDEPILIDFGLSKQYDSEGHQTSTTPTGISHGYAPLEQYNDGGVKEFSPQTDLYSLAATLYYLLSGVVPPQATRLVDDELTFPASMPTRFIEPIYKAMSTARRKRHDSIGTFLCDIKENQDTTVIKPILNSIKEPEQQDQEPEPEKPIAPHYDPDSEVFVEEYDSDSKKKRDKNILLAAIFAPFVVLIGLLIWANYDSTSIGNSENNASEMIAEIQDSEGNIYRKDISYNSALGVCSYSGYVDQDGHPNGNGKAVWESGVGKEYDGQWVHGDMDGDCTYVSSKGYRFEGKFKLNHYNEGKLTNPDNTYYVGTFDKNGDKYTGIEYDANGNQTDTWKNGE